MLSGRSDFQIGSCFRDLNFESTADSKAWRVKFEDLHRKEKKNSMGRIWKENRDCSNTTWIDIVRWEWRHQKFFLFSFFDPSLHKFRGQKRTCHDQKQWHKLRKAKYIHLKILQNKLAWTKFIAHGSQDSQPLWWRKWLSWIFHWQMHYLQSWQSY